MVVDTLLVSIENKFAHVFSLCSDLKEYWVQLLEKAYAKLHGSYEAIQALSVEEILKELTGGGYVKMTYSEEEAKTQKSSNLLFKYILEGLEENKIIGCIRRVEAEDPTKLETAEVVGTLDNHYYGIVLAKEFDLNESETVKLVKLRNPWGDWGEWSGDFCNHGEDWDRNAHIRKELFGDGSKVDKKRFFSPIEDILLYFREFLFIQVGAMKPKTTK